MKVTIEVRSGRGDSVRVKSWRVLLFSKKEKRIFFPPRFAVNSDSLMFAVPVIRKDKDGHDKTSKKFAANNIRGVKRKDRRCDCCRGPTKSLPFMDRSGLLGERLQCCKQRARRRIDLYFNILKRLESNRSQPVVRGVEVLLFFNLHRFLNLKTNFNIKIKE